jgi:transcriptional regulator with XRE-family HTH domain
MPKNEPFHGGPVIRAAREGKNLQREQLALLIGRSVRSVELYEANRVCPPYSVLQRIAAAVDVDLADLTSSPTGTAA